MSLANVSEYSLHATLGSPKVDIMVMNMPKVTKVTFKDHKKEQEDSYLEAKVKIERMYSLFQMVAPQYWIFYGFSDREEKSKSGRLANSFLCQRLERETFQGQLWTNFEFKNIRRDHMAMDRGRRKLLLSGKFRHDIAQDLCKKN